MGTNEIPFKIIHAQAAGIDVGSRSHLVAVDQNKENVREFGVYTKDHQQMISHLHAYGITTIAMESTGSYWQTLFNALQQAGFEVVLVNGSQTKNVKRGGPRRSKNRPNRLHLDSETALAWSVVRQFTPERYLPTATHLLLPSPTFN